MTASHGLYRIYENIEHSGIELTPTLATAIAKGYEFSGGEAFASRNGGAVVTPTVEGGDLVGRIVNVLGNSAHGMTVAQIAQACGTSVQNVRNAMTKVRSVSGIRLASAKGERTSKGGPVPTVWRLSSRASA